MAIAIAGEILTYARSYSVGDWVKAGDTAEEANEENARNSHSRHNK